MMNSSDLRITVIVCARNAKSRLEETLASLAAQTFSSYEVLVVDNDSNDGTAEWLEEKKRLYNYTLLHESELGLSAARNCGIRNAKGELIAFIDDDAVAPSYWLDRLWSAYSHEKPECIGGAVHGLWESTPPLWLTSNRWRGLSLLSYGPKMRPLVYPEILIGCNVCFRRDVFEKYGLFDAKLGRKGSNLIGNEERDLEKRIADDGGTILYVPDACVFHKVPAGRMTHEYFAQRQRDGVISDLTLRKARGVSEAPLWKTLLQPIHDFVYIPLRSFYRGLKIMIETCRLEMRLAKASREGSKRYRAKKKRG